MLAIKFFAFIMFGFKDICWALLFIFKLRFPPGVSISLIKLVQFRFTPVAIIQDDPYLTSKKSGLKLTELFSLVFLFE